MDRALALARQARGSTRPNPPVGAVLVKDGRTIGEGFTQPAGGAHAEIVALAAAGNEAAGADLFVTLEPCSHWGRTPPCADALIAARIARAHVALLDPNPLVNGAGAAKLRHHGIAVEVGQGAEAAADLIEAHATRMRLQRPFITLVLAIPDRGLEEIGRDADALIVDGSLPGAWTGAAYRLSRDRSGIHATRARIAALPLPDRVDAEDLRELFLKFGSAGVSSLMAAGTIAVPLLREGLVDKLVAGPEAVVPQGFVLRLDTYSAFSCRTYYPAPAS
jgi:pyrimidine deaminase RibD-like protein